MGPAGTLRPGESGSVSIPSRTRAAGRRLNFQVQIADDSQPMDWASQEPALQIPTIPDAAWPVVFANFVANVGSTVGSYHAALAADATYLSQHRRADNDVIQLLSFEIEKANAAYTAQTLVSVTADSLPAPGMDLTFVQSFQQSISGRYTQGILGYGWTTNWDISATTMTNGDVAIENDGVSAYFSLQPNGSFAPEAGDEGTTLTVSGGAYQLVEPDGTIYQFNANGTLNYVQDTNGNRITAGYNAQGQLVSLTDSNGEYLDLTYNAQGHLATLTDSNGQTETYGYDPTGQFLTSYTDVYGTTNYTYVTGQSAAQDNALAEITYADNTHIYFSYDSQGRLIDQHRDGGPGRRDVRPTSAPAATSRPTATATQTTVYFNLYGATAETIDPLGNVTRYYYDSNLNLTKVVGPGGTTYTYTYDANGNLTSETDPLGLTTTLHLQRQQQPDQLHRRQGQHDQLRLRLRSNDLLSITYANGTQQQYSYNPLGEATQFLNANGQAIGYTYNAEGLVTHGDLRRRHVLLLHLQRPRQPDQRHRRPGQRHHLRLRRPEQPRSAHRGRVPRRHLAEVQLQHRRPAHPERRSDRLHGQLHLRLAGPALGADRRQRQPDRPVHLRRRRQPDPEGQRQRHVHGLHLRRRRRRRSTITQLRPRPTARSTRSTTTPTTPSATC